MHAYGFPMPSSQPKGSQGDDTEKLLGTTNKVCVHVCVCVPDASYGINAFRVQAFLSESLPFKACVERGFSAVSWGQAHESARLQSVKVQHRALSRV